MKYLVCITLLLFGCSKSQISPVPNVPDAAKKVYFIGDSITYGYGASDSSKRWTSLYCASKGYTEINKGVIGEVLEDSTNCAFHYVFDKTAIPLKKSDGKALFISLGTNDIGDNNGKMSPEGYKTALSNLVDYAINQMGWPKTSIVIAGPYLITNKSYFLSRAAGCTVSAWDDARLQAYVNAALTVASAKGCISADIYRAMAGYSVPAHLLSNDGIHPNDAGHQFIATFMRKLTL
ncbi:MAG: SGNH/GDSL hydrolase family protein [Sphingobacteriales bacterium]